MISKKRFSKRKRRGAAALEFALVAPMFLVVLAVCGEFSRMCTLRNLAHNAAYEAARFTMAEGAKVEDGIEKAEEILGRLGNVEASVQINGMDGSETDEDIEATTQEIRVDIQIALRDNAMCVPGSIYGDREITATMTMRTERYRGFFDSTND